MNKDKLPTTTESKHKMNDMGWIAEHSDYTIWAKPRGGYKTRGVYIQVSYRWDECDGKDAKTKSLRWGYYYLANYIERFCRIKAKPETQEATQ